jgi:biopolymer transport protein ExbD
MKEAIEEVGRVVTHDLDRFLTTLGTIAAMAPLLGLLGTVIGMIEIFGSQQSNSSNPIQLAHGISIALYNTAMGIIVAVPALIFYRHFRAKGGRAGRRDGAAGHQARRLRARGSPVNLRGARGREDPEINFIPLIDVLLVILIFLMVTTTYQRVAELQITLPEAEADPAKQRPKEINIGIDAQGRYVVDKTIFTFSTVPALADVLRRAAGDAKEPVIIINADANATHQSVIHVMEAARQAGLIHITFATQTPGK